MLRASSSYFNSIMVRLRPNWCKRNGMRELHFNSIMVRLRRGQQSVGGLLPPKFQFHYGAIKTRCLVLSYQKDSLFQFHYGAIKTDTHKPRCCRQEDFNSIMVRLRPSCCKTSWSTRQQFQFHYGAIKTKRWSTSSTLPTDFNSIMVRLRPDVKELVHIVYTNFNSIMVRLRQDRPEGGKWCAPFQFHYGAIKTRSICKRRI